MILLLGISVFFALIAYNILPGRKKIAFLGFYILMTLLMFADVIYFKYFNQSFTFQSFASAGQLPDVSGTLQYLIGLKELLLFTDFVIFSFLIFQLDARGIGKIPKPKLDVKLFWIIAGLILCLVLLCNPMRSETVIGIQREEFFTYHLRDICAIIAETIDSADSKDSVSVMERTHQDGNEYNGIANGRNLIIIQVESLQDMVINRKYDAQEITPVLNDLIKNDSFYFSSYYQMLGAGNTSDAEFVSNNSIYAPLYGQAYDIYRDNAFYGLPWILRDQGYETLALHGYKKEFWNRNLAYPNQGFEDFKSQENYTITEPIGFGLSDHDFFKQSIPYLKSLNQPFYSFFVTLSSHNPYHMPEKYQKLSLNDADKGTMFGDYLQAVNYTDTAIGQFIEQLKSNGLYDNSMIVIYGDHFGLSCKDASFHDNVSNFIGYNYDYDEMMNVPMIIHIPGCHISKTVDTVGGQVDFLPTILNLMGVESKNPFIFGQDLLNAQSGFVASQTYMIKGSFIQDDIVFSMSRDGVFGNSRAWNRKTHEPVDLDLCLDGYQRAITEISAAMKILKGNELKQIKDGQLNSG
jgi:phosphoglycerol transferase MdoB-like AlkP superfamily enzyme